MKVWRSPHPNVPAILLSLLAIGCVNGKLDHDALTISLLEDVINAKDDSLEHVKALWELFKHGKEVEDVGDLWLQGPSHVEPKPAYEDLLALKGARMSRIDKIHYVFYGFREAVGTLSLLCVRNYPDGIQRFVKLSEASITAENYPGIEFATDSRWKMPQPWPGSTDVPEDRR